MTKKNTILTLAVLAAASASAALTRLVPEHGISKAFTLKSDRDVEYVVRFYRPDVFRVEAAPKVWTGEGTNRICTLDYADHRNDPAKAQMLLADYREDTTGVAFADRDGKFTFTTTEMVVEFDKATERMSVYGWARARGGAAAKPVLAEAEPLSFASGECRQVLASAADVRYYGGGQQVGRFTHKGRKIAIDCDYNWADGGAPNPAPFVLSSEGFGILRHTFSAGAYDFTAADTCLLAHAENRFDAFYFIGDFATVIDRYTEATGRPNLLPMWGLELGDADAYMTRDPKTKLPKQEADGSFTEVTPCVERIAAAYREADMPGSWILVNDGYGCGYTMLGSVIRTLDQYGFKTGLWTEGALDRIAWEVGTAGTRVQKLDVAWTSQGGDFKMQHALQCNEDAFLGMTTNSEARAFIWTVLGWAGTQRYGICWAGDQYGGWDLIRYMIPTVSGSAMSGQAYATTDVDGIFGGSNETYLRDLQWKCWTTAMYVMNGWSNFNKGPWSLAEPYRSHVRDCLKHKIRMTPFLYALMRRAWEDGSPIVRPMVWNYPADPVTWDDATKYQFTVGQDVLVAPVYTKAAVNKGWWCKGIYLPDEAWWYDYNDGRRVAGSQWLWAYPVDLSKIPVFVRPGAMLPMYDEGLSTLTLDRTCLTFDVWPGPRGGHFVTYEDDGSTRAYQKGESARYFAHCSGTCTADEIGDQEIFVRPVVRETSRGTYAGAPNERVFAFDIHLQSAAKPWQVVMDGYELVELKTTNCVKRMFANVREGWYYDPDEKFGTLHVKLRARPYGAADRPFAFTVRMSETAAAVARVRTPAYPQPSAEAAEAAAEAASCKAVRMPQLNNTNSAKHADGDDMVMKAGANPIIIDSLDGTYTRITGHVATHPDNDPAARFTFRITANNSKQLFERANMKGSDVPQLIAVDIPSGTGWVTFSFTADNDEAVSRNAKGVWKNVNFDAE